jgi:hypothetical protein
VLHPKANVGVMVECLVAGFTEVVRLEGNGLVAVFPRDFDAAIPVAVLHVRPSENYQAGLEFLDVGQKRHLRAPSVQNLCIKKL